MRKGMLLGEMVWEWRSNMGHTQQQFANMVGLSRSAISRLENRGDVSGPHLIKLLLFVLKPGANWGRQNLKMRPRSRVDEKR